MSFNNSHRILWQRQYAFDLCFALITLFLPFLIFLHLLFDVESNYITFLGFEYFHTFINNEAFAWYVISNTISLWILVLAFITSQGKWRWFLLPIIGNFFCTLIYGFTSSESYLIFLIKPIGIISLILILCWVFILNLKTKHNIQELSVSNQTIWNELFYSWNGKFNSRLKIIIKDKSKFSLREYVFRIYHLSELIKRKHRYSLINEEHGFSKSKNIIDVVFAFLTLATLLLLFIDNFIPPDDQSINLGGIIIGSFGFQDVKTFSWYISQKFALCLITIIWLFSCVSWWRWAILSPIIFYSYQFWESFQPVYAVDGPGNLNVFPFVFLTILGVLLLSKVIRRVSINLDNQEFLEEELEKSIEELSRLERGA